MSHVFTLQLIPFRGWSTFYLEPSDLRRIASLYAVQTFAVAEQAGLGLELTVGRDLVLDT